MLIKIGKEWIPENRNTVCLNIQWKWNEIGIVFHVISSRSLCTKWNPEKPLVMDGMNPAIFGGDCEHWVGLKAEKKF